MSTENSLQTTLKTMVIADDSRVMQALIQRMLGKHFRILAVANNGIEAFEHFKLHRPNITLLDLTMPNCNGKECLEMIMKDDPKACVIMFSGINDDQTVAECLKLGAKAFVCKEGVSPQQSPDDNPLLQTILKYAMGEGTNVRAS